MGEYAYDFTGQNAHDGPSRNPHDLEHMTGGSSGGSGGAVAGGLTPIALGSDTNGSIRVPSSFCGVFGLKPTYGRLSRAGTFPFVASLDHLGPFARSVCDLALSYDAMLGRDEADPAQADVAAAPATPAIEDGVAGLRIAKLAAISPVRGNRAPSPRSIRSPGLSRLSGSWNLPGRSGRAPRPISSPWSRAPRCTLVACAPALRTSTPTCATGLSPGRCFPEHGRRRRRNFGGSSAEALALFREVDILLAPATPCRAPKLGQKTFVLDGKEMLVRPNLGLFTQPISFIGLPVVAVPVWTEAERLPIGVQIIAPPWREDLALRVARGLEQDGVVRAPVARLV